MPLIDLTRRRALALAAMATAAGVSPARAQTSIKNVLVIGGSGRTGGMAVKDLLARGMSVRGLARRVDQAKAEHPQVEWVAGDVRQAQTLGPAMTGMDAVVYAVGSTRDHDPSNGADALFDIGVRDTVNAAKAAKVKHIVLLSSAGVGRIGTKDADPLTAVMTAKKNGEDHVRKSGLTYSIVRTHGVWDKIQGELGVLLIQGDLAFKSRMMISRKDIARVLAECVTNTEAHGKSFEIINVASPDPDLWKQEFSRLTKDF